MAFPPPPCHWVRNGKKNVSGEYVYRKMKEKHAHYNRRDRRKQAGQRTYQTLGHKQTKDGTGEKDETAKVLLVKVHLTEILHQNFVMLLHQLFQARGSLCFLSLVSLLLVTAQCKRFHSLNGALTLVAPVLTSMEKQKSGETFDRVTLGDGALDRTVNFGYVHMANQVGGQLFPLFRQRFAMTAPRSIELDKPITSGRTRCSLRIVVKRFISQRLDIGGRWRRCGYGLRY